MRGTLAKKIRKMMPEMEPGYEKLSNGQIISRKRMQYKKAKKEAKN